ncbi:hypothetical protein [Chlorobium phaeobacteroides]|uniref:Uncharacterized protein n=1 Tax=Chlorobium phaeobacteroides (strain DSM 266 / SMG 266 / 2430) TaxID=290317 RepID=A1BDI9_CHLPD|nr:hypothetical protein [Chlorobium phaeobacteroides]ABL64466.1 conserved hypothetical protein [Chlorobium phaeobacteroides DSM 266]MBV5319767.1 hypothetical protein [Chlorobium phaeobacteroides]
MKHNIDTKEEEVRKIMQLLDEMQPLKVSPLFRVHLMEKVEAVSNNRRSETFHSFNPRLAFAALLVVINISSAMLFFSSTEQQAKETASNATETVNDDYTSPALAYYTETGTEFSGSELNDNQNSNR